MNVQVDGSTLNFTDITNVNPPWLERWNVRIATSM